jgi:uncharacterized protein YbjQ (UPF0145 family)
LPVWVYILVGVVALILIGYAVSAVVGVVVWLAIAAAIGAVIVGQLRMSLGGSSKVLVTDRRQEKKLDSAADRALKELEKKSRE